MPPDLGSEPGRVEAAGPHPGGDENVRHGIAVAQGQHLVAISIVQQAQRPGPRCLDSQHASRVTAPAGERAGLRASCPLPAGSQPPGAGSGSAAQVAFTAPGPPDSGSAPVAR